MSELQDLLIALDSVNRDIEQQVAKLLRQAQQLNQAAAHASTVTTGSSRAEGERAAIALKVAQRAVSQAAQHLHQAALAGKGFVARYAGGGVGPGALFAKTSPEFAPNANLEPPEPVASSPKLLRSLGALASRLAGGPKGTPLSGLPGTHTAVHSALDRAGASLTRWDANDQALCAKWMGDSSDATRSRLQQIAANMRQRTGDIELVPFEPGQGGPNTFAYVYPNDPGYHIYVGDLFWRQNDSPPPMDSRAGVLIHELSHFSDVGGTHDHVYGQEESASFAETFGSKESLDNADSVEYFFEGFLI